jgi:hypothetical protein
MSKRGRDGYYAGLHDRPYQRPHGVIDAIFSGPKELRRQNQENREFSSNYDDGKREARRRRKERRSGW